MTEWTKGIKVIWPSQWPPEPQVAIDEIEYFCGIDVNQLDDIPKFTRVRAFSPRDYPDYPNWPRWIEYVVAARCERNPSNENEVRLAVTYDQGKNPEIVRLYRMHGIRDIAGLWGTNTIVLTQGRQCGHYEWLGLGDTSPEDIVRGQWKSFDLRAGQGDPEAARADARKAPKRAKVERRRKKRDERDPEAEEAARAARTDARKATLGKWVKWVGIGVIIAIGVALILATVA